MQDDQLRQALSFHTLLVGGSPFAASSIYALIHALERDGGVWFARGGTHALVRGAGEAVRGPGRQADRPDAARRIVTEAGRVTGVVHADGSSRPSTPWPPTPTWSTPTRTCWRTTPRGRAVARRLKRRRFSPSLFVLHFGLKRRAPGACPPHHLFGPRYRGLIDEIYGKDALADDFSLYLHAPSVTDPSLAPPGCSAYYVLSPVPHLGVATIDWDVEGPRYADRILDYLRGALIPGLKADLVTTPHLHAEGLRARAERLAGLGLLAGAGADPERLVPHPQPRRRDRQPLFRRRRNPSRRRRAGRDRLGQGDGGADDRDLRRRPMTDTDLVQASRETIQKGSTSFAAAAALFDAETRADAEMLYAWCRHCDDVIDGQELGHGMVAPGPDAAPGAAEGALRQDPRRPGRRADPRSRLRRLPARRPAPPHPRALRHRAARRLRHGRRRPAATRRWRTPSTTAGTSPAWSG